MTPDMLVRLRAALAAKAPPQSGFCGIAAAVLVPIFTHQGELHLLYTRRSESLPHHSGQVSFPGGRHMAANDRSLLATALRETDEEIGVVAHDVDVLGEMAPIHTFSSNFVITPFVGVIPYPYAFRANLREVSEIFSVPLAVLADPATTHEEEWTLDGQTFPVATYRHAGHVIWGATQRITATLLDMLEALAVGS